MVWCSLALGASSAVTLDLCTNSTLFSSDVSMYDYKPSVFGDYVLWNADNQIVIYDAIKKEIVNVTLNEYAVADAVLVEEKIVWVGFNEEAQIYGCSIRKNGKDSGCLSGDKKVKMTNTVSLKRNPAISGSTVVWEEFDGHDFEIMLCDQRKNERKGGCLADDKKIQITENEYEDRNPQILHDLLVWEAKTKQDWDIWIYNRESKRKKPLVEEQGDQLSPRIGWNSFGYKVIFSSREHEETNIMVKSLNTGIITPITAGNNLNEWAPVIDGMRSKTLWWLSDKYGLSNIEGLKNGKIIDMRLENYSIQKNIGAYNGTIVFEQWNKGVHEIVMAQC